MKLKTLICIRLLGVLLFASVTVQACTQKGLDESSSNNSQTAWKLPIAIQHFPDSDPILRDQAIQLRDFLKLDSSLFPVIEIDSNVDQIPNNVFYLEIWGPLDSYGYIILIQDTGARLIASSVDEVKNAIARLKSLAKVTDNGVVLPTNQLITDSPAVNNFILGEDLRYTDKTSSMVMVPGSQKDLLSDTVKKVTNKFNFFHISNSTNRHPLCRGMVWIELIMTDSSNPGYLIAIQDNGILVYSTSVSESIKAVNVLGSMSKSVDLRFKNLSGEDKKLLLPSNLIVTSFPLIDN